MAGDLGRVYFIDDNALGPGKLLRRSGRDDVLYPGHEDYPKSHSELLTSNGCQRVASRQLIVLTRDKVWLGAKQDLGPRDPVELFLKHEARLRREIIKRGSGPGRWQLS